MKALPSKSLVLLMTVGMVSMPCASYGEGVTGRSDKGTRYEAEWKTLRALDPDYEVVQLTTAKALDNKMYLDVNPYVPALDSVVFMSQRRSEDDAENFFLMSLEDGTFVQLTDSDDIDGDHGNVSPETEEVFFRDKRTFKRVSLHPPYREREIYTVPDRYDPKGILSLTSDGKTIASSFYDEDEDRSSLVIVDVATGRLETIKRIDGKVDHVLINPVRGDTLLYHIFDEHEIGIVDIATKTMKVLTKPGDHGVHPFWTANGAKAAYVEKNSDPERVVTYHLRAGRYVDYDIPKRGNHFAINPSQTLLQSDGSGSDRNIYYYEIDRDGNTVDYRKMFEHDSSSDEESVHPHAAFINDTDLIFNSDADGNGNVYLLREKSD